MFSTLNRALDDLLLQRERLPHALLIHGPQGIGKRWLAERLAAALLCEHPDPLGQSCGTCTACHWMQAEDHAHPDFRLIEPVGQEGDADSTAEESPVSRAGARVSAWIKVDQIRELHDYIQLSSHRQGRRLVLIAPAEALNTEAANALLKSLEEPPSGVQFILISHQPARLLRTVISRCRQLAIAKPPCEEALAWLKQEKLPQPEVALAQASGAPLLARTLAESGDLTGRLDFLRRIATPGLDPVTAATALSDVKIRPLLGWMQRWVYDLVSQHFWGCIRFNPDLQVEIAALSKHIGPRETLRFLRQLMREQRIADHPLNTRLYLENLLLAYRQLFGQSGKGG